jgi:hypothetical protein
MGRVLPSLSSHHPFTRWDEDLYVLFGFCYLKFTQSVTSQWSTPDFQGNRSPSVMAGPAHLVALLSFIDCVLMPPASKSCRCVSPVSCIVAGALPDFKLFAFLTPSDKRPCVQGMHYGVLLLYRTSGKVGGGKDITPTIISQLVIS